MMTRVQIGPFSCLKVEGSAEAATGVLFHGYGADASDLAALASLLKTEAKINWIFPDAPELIDLGLGMQGRAWFPLDIGKMEIALRSNNFESFIEERHAGLEKIKAQIDEFISSLNISPEKLYLGGFSQGSMIATDASLRMSEDVRGLIILSGTLVAPKEWADAASRHKGMPFFQSHGQVDPLLPAELATKLEKTLIDGGMKGRLRMFQGGHEIPMPIIQELISFLNECEKSD